MRVRIVALVVIAGLVAVGMASAMTAATKLKGTVGPGFTISLKSATGKKVKTLKAGRYTFVVTDKASDHNFTLDGPGFDDKVITGTGFTGTKSKTLTLKKGSFKFYCTLHPFMNGKFRVS